MNCSQVCNSSYFTAIYIMHVCVYITEETRTTKD